MPDAASPTFALTITTASYAEIFLLDSRLELIQSGLGRLETRQPPGVYKVKIRQGREAREELVLLDKDASLEFAAPEFSTAVPILETRRSHEFHHDVARRYSQQSNAELGEGTKDATIFVLARSWTGRTDVGRRFAPPAKGLTLQAFDGGESLDLGSQARGGDGPDWDPSAGCTVSVPAGPYVLRAQMPDGAVTEQVIIASPGWQTQVFVLRQPMARERGVVRVPTSEPDDVSTAPPFDISVLMGRGSLGDDAQLRLTELAGIAVADERPVLPTELTTILSSKFDNPVLGIFGAHLLLILKERADQDTRRPTPTRERQAIAGRSASTTFDPSLFDHVVDMLRGLVGHTHPDVEALSLRCRLETLRSQGVFRVPPMLRRSWSLVVQATREAPALLPLDTWRRVSRMVPSRPFLSWLVDGVEASVDEDVAREFLERLTILQRGRPRTVRRGESADAPQAMPLAAPGPSEPSLDLRRKLSLDLDMPMSAVNWMLDAPPGTRNTR